jgi:hypothetical protein
MAETAGFNDQTCYRLIPNKFPPISLFDDVADGEDFEELFAVQAMTNPRLQAQIGDLNLVPKGERIFGIEGSGHVMAAFTHVNPDGSRFSNGEYGIFYGAADLKDAIEETRYHRAMFMGYTKEPAQEIDMRCLVAKFSATLTDIRAVPYLGTALYHPTDYSQGQSLGLQCKKDGLDGIAYSSVRGKGDCFALFKPSLISNCVQASHFGYVWNCQTIVEVYKKELDFNSP